MSLRTLNAKYTDFVDEKFALDLKMSHTLLALLLIHHSFVLSFSVVDRKYFYITGVGGSPLARAP